MTAVFHLFARVAPVKFSSNINSSWHTVFPLTVVIEGWQSNESSFIVVLVVVSRDVVDFKVVDRGVVDFEVVTLVVLDVALVVGLAVVCMVVGSVKYI